MQKIMATLNAVKVGETVRMNDCPCYPIFLTREGQDVFRYQHSGEAVNLREAARRSLPWGSEIYG